MRAMPSPTDRTVPTSVSSAWPSSRPSMRLLRMEVISSGLICMSAMCSFGRRRASARATCLRSCSRRLRIEASRIELPTRRTMPPRMSGSTSAVELDLAAGLLADPVADALDGRLVELDGAS